jgi:hypothetical protein
MITSSDKQLVNDILSLPNAPIILQEVNNQLEAEKQKREKFYNEITEHEKAEFINGEKIECKAVTGFKIAIESIFDEEKNFAEAQKILS